MSAIRIDKQQMLEHLRALRHRHGEVTQVCIERWLETTEDEDRLRRNGTPLRWTGFYEPSRYDALIDDVLRFFREHEVVVFSVYAGANPRTLAVLPYADHRIRSYMDIAGDQRTPRYPDRNFVIRRGILFDLDYKTATKGTPRPKGNPALTVARDLRATVPELQLASVFNTGNNAALVAHLPDGEYPDDAIKAFFADVATEHDLVPPEGKAGVKLDPTWDSFRIMGLSGTPKRKGADPSKWRDQTIEVVGEESPILAATITRFSHEFKVKAAAKPKAAPKASAPTVTPAARQMGLDIDDLVVSWCPGYRYLWDVAVEGDRSRILFNLAVKMLWHGWTDGDVERALRTWSSRRGIERPDRWYDRVLTSAKEKCENGVVPSHKTVVAMLGSCPCEGGCELDQAAGPRGRGKLLELEWDESKYLNQEKALAVGQSLAVARDDQAIFLRQAIQLCTGKNRPAGVPPRKANPAGAPERPILCLVTGPPGVGKTHVARELTRRHKVAWFFDRKSEMAKLDIPKRRSDLEVREIGSRADLCTVDTSRSLLNRMAKRGLSMAGRQVCVKCRLVKTCRYTTQFDGMDGRSIAAASAWIGTPRAEELVQHAEFMIFDEDPLTAAFQKETVTVNDLDALHEVAVAIGFGNAPVRLVAALAELFALPGHGWKQIETEDAGLRRWLIGRLSAPSDWTGLRPNFAKWAATEQRVRDGIGVDRLPAAHLTRLAEVIHAAAGDPKAPCPLYLSSHGARTLEHISSFKPITLNKPGLVLDATGEIEIYRRLFPNHEVYEDPTKASIKAQVIQICDQRLPMRTFREPGKWEQVSAIIKNLAKARVLEMGGGKVLVVGRRELMNRLPADQSIVTTHYGGQRGSREFEDCHTAIIVGTPEPPVEQMAAYAEAMLGEAVSRARGVVERPYNLPVPGKQNRSYGVRVPVYENELLQRLVARVREAEVEQAGYRIRPLDPSRPNLKIFLLTSIPLRLLPPTQVPITLAELEVLAKGT